MSACPPGSAQTIQVIEPDSTLPVTNIPAPGYDPSMTESGDVFLALNQSSVTVQFKFTKAGDYRFEYLYVDGMGAVHPGIIEVVPVSQSIYGFTVELAGIPKALGRVLRWRVVVVTIVQSPGDLTDAPESFRVALPQESTLLVNFINVRSNSTYGFSELRVENLVDSADSQSPVLPQVVLKTTSFFVVALSPVPPTANYYLVARVP